MKSKEDWKGVWIFFFWIASPAYTQKGDKGDKELKLDVPSKPGKLCSLYIRRKCISDHRRSSETLGDDQGSDRQSYPEVVKKPVSFFKRCLIRTRKVDGPLPM